MSPLFDWVVQTITATLDETMDGMGGPTIAVTGATGFLGTHVCRRFAETTSVYSTSTSTGSGLSTQRHHRGDLTDSKTAEQAIPTDTDVVIHLAAEAAVDSEEPSTQFRQNVGMTQAVLQRCREITPLTLLFASSGTVYGQAPTPTPETYGPLAPRSHYGASKLASEALCSVAASTHDVDVIIARLGNVVGPGLPEGSVIPDFIAKLETDPSELTIIGDGRQRKSFVHVEDVLDAFECLLEADTDSYTVCNVAAGSTTAVETIATIVANECGVDPAYHFTDAHAGDVSHVDLAIDSLRQYGYDPTYTSNEAVRQAVQALLQSEKV